MVASGGRTTARQRTGAVLFSFASALPNGGAGSHGRRAGGRGGGGGRCGGVDYSILDCIYVEETELLVVCDVMCWKGHSLYDCSAEFRLFWLNTKLVEDAPGLADLTDDNQRRIIPLAWYTADAAGLDAAYRGPGPLPFVRDGLMLLHREGYYALGLSPLMLLWKDAHCSTYLTEVYPGVDPAIQVSLSIPPLSLILSLPVSLILSLCLSRRAHAYKCTLHLPPPSPLSFFSPSPVWACLQMRTNI